MNTSWSQSPAKGFPYHYRRLRDKGKHIEVCAIEGTQLAPPLLLEFCAELIENGTEVVKMAFWFQDHIIDLTMMPECTILYRVGK